MGCSQEVKDLLKTLYGLSSSESEVLTLLCDGEGRRIEVIAEEVGKDRSTVQRYISKLRAVGLVSRRAETEGRGRFYIYRIDKEKMKKKVKNRLDEWVDEKLEELERI